MKKYAALAAFLAITPAKAAPPEGADMTFAPYYHALTQPVTGWGCCSIADCRPVAMRFKDNAIEIFVDKKSFGYTAPDAWLVVPEEVIIKNPPTGLPRPQEPIACWYDKKIRCFDNPAWGG